MGDDDIRAFSRPELATLATLPAPRRRRWPWVLLALALLGLAILLSLGSLVWHEVQGPHGLAGVPGIAAIGDWHVGIDEDGWHGNGGAGGVLLAVVAVLVALLVVTVVVPLVLLGVGLAVGLSLALAAVSVLATLGLVLGGAALVLLVATAPLWAIGLLLWWALRPARPAVASAPAH